VIGSLINSTTITNSQWGAFLVVSPVQTGTPSIVYNAAKLQSWCAITEWHIAYRHCLNTSSTGSPTTGYDNILVVIDRERTGWYSVWRYPSSTSLGLGGDPYQAVVFGVDNLLFMSGADGQVYCQPTRVIDQNNLFGVFESPAGQFTQDSPGVNVTSTYRSRLTDLGQPTLSKQLRSIMFMGTCAANSMSMSLNTLGFNGLINTGFEPVAGQRQTVPYETQMNLSEVSTGFTNFWLIQLQFSAQNLWLKEYAWVWRSQHGFTAKGNLSG
jgi:hypothetical protein